MRDILADGGDWVEVGGERKHVIGYLKDFLFTPDALDAKVETFSGGERSRLLLAREFAKPSNLLILDEPTNDLDLETLDLLQEVIDDYAGTVLLVSHDRDFLDRTVTMVVGLDGSGTADVVVGGYGDWQAKRKADLAPPPPPKAAAPVAARRTVKLTYIEQRELDQLPGQIEAIGKAIARAETAMGDPGLYARDPNRFDALNAEADGKRRALAGAEERWLVLSEKAETLAA